MKSIVRYSTIFKNNLIRFINKAIEPHASITDPEDRYRSRMLNSLVVIFLPIAICVILFRWIVLPHDVFTTIVISFLGILVVFSIYVVGRSGHYRASVYTTVLLGYGIIYLNAVNSTTPHFEIAYLTFLPMLGIVLFTMREALLNYLIAISLMIIFLSTIGDIEHGIAIDLLVYMLLTQGIIFFANYQRTRLDTNRHDLILERKRSEVIKTLIDNVSHDFKTPVSVIYTSIYLIRHAKTPERQEKGLIQIENQAGRIESMIQDLLNVSRLDQDIKLLAQDIDFWELITDTVQGLLSIAKSKHITVEQLVETDKRHVSGVWGELERMVYSIVINAINFTPEHGTVTIRLSSKDEGYLSLQVIDTGIGIDDDDLPYIFDHFYRADKARSTQTGGSGLGLPIAKQVIERHQGCITVDSKLGHGTTFCISLPISEVETNPISSLING